MGTKDDMLRKYLIVIGFGAIISGIIFFFTSLTAMYHMLNGEDFVYAEGFWLKTIAMSQAAQSSGVDMFKSMALGGICLYLARKISKETQLEATVDETSTRET